MIAPRLITSQHFLSDEKIAEKMADADFDVLVSPEFEVEGETFRAILDGNHSYAAAIKAGTEPQVTEASATDHDAVALIAAGDVEGFLSALHMGEGDYIDVATRKYVW